MSNLPTDTQLSDALQAISGRLINRGYEPLHHRHPSRVSALDLLRAARDLGYPTVSELLEDAGA